ncbi:MAG TPA: hypothetical protein VN081_03195 [Dongiaceae bacterium]|nr:hypothetical protein [Dongiaceae bacterium]
MNIFVIALLIWFVGMVISSGYIYTHRPTFEEEGTVTLLILLLIFIWPLVILLDFVLHGRGAIDVFKSRLLT